MSDFKIGFITQDEWTGQDHRLCETERHDGLKLPAIAVIALSALNQDGSLDESVSAVYGVCPECFGMIDRDMAGPWKLPGPYSH